jgi:hypothetical protein
MPPSRWPNIFPDDEHRDVLLLIDNIFRFIQAGMKVSGLMGQMPSRLGYQPTSWRSLQNSGGKTSIMLWWPALTTAKAEAPEA